MAKSTSPNAQIVRERAHRDFVVAEEIPGENDAVAAMQLRAHKRDLRRVLGNHHHEGARNIFVVEDSRRFIRFVKAGRPRSAALVSFF